MKVCSHQPSLFPWIGYWHKVDAADLLIMSCGVKMDYAGYQNRVELQGSWLTVPVPKGSKHVLLKDVRFDRAALPKIAHRILQGLAGKRWPGREQVHAIVARGLSCESDFLVDLNIAGFQAVRDVLGITTPFVVDDVVPPEDAGKTERLVERIRRHVPDDAVYLAGAGLLDYLDRDRWPKDLGLAVQRSNGALDSGSVVQLIAQQADALPIIRAAFHWEPVDAQEDPGRLSALG